MAQSIVVAPRFSDFYRQDGRWGKVTKINRRAKRSGAQGRLLPTPDRELTERTLKMMKSSEAARSGSEP